MKYHAGQHFISMDWQKTLYPGLWCMLFIIAGLLVWTIKIVSGYTDPVLAYAYYGCAIAALFALCFMFVKAAKVITDREEKKKFFYCFTIQGI